MIPQKTKADFLYTETDADKVQQELTQQLQWDYFTLGHHVHTGRGRAALTSI